MGMHSLRWWFEPTRIIREGERVFPFQPDVTVGKEYKDILIEEPGIGYPATRKLIKKNDR